MDKCFDVSEEYCKHLNAKHHKFYPSLCSSGLKTLLYACMFRCTDLTHIKKNLSTRWMMYRAHIWSPCLKNALTAELPSPRYELIMSLHPVAFSPAQQLLRVQVPGFMKSKGKQIQISPQLMDLVLISCCWSILSAKRLIWAWGININTTMQYSCITLSSVF